MDERRNQRGEGGVRPRNGVCPAQLSEDMTPTLREPERASIRISIPHPIPILPGRPSTSLGLVWSWSGLVCSVLVCLPACPSRTLVNTIHASYLSARVVPEQIIYWLWVNPSIPSRLPFYFCKLLNFLPLQPSRRLLFQSQSTIELQARKA
jgi:hypothetical protein